MLSLRKGSVIHFYDRLIRVAILTCACIAFAGCTSPAAHVSNRPECDPGQQRQADHLQSSPILKDMPEGVNLRHESTVLPCEDDDGIGRVGWNGMVSLTGE